MQRLKADIRLRLLQVAASLFTEHGYLKTSMRDVADQAGIGVGNIYHYFANKDELFRAVLRPLTNELEKMLQAHHGLPTNAVEEMRSDTYAGQIADEFINLIDRYGGLLELLLFHAQGSSLEHFREQFAENSTATVRLWLQDIKQKYPELNTAVSDFLIRLHTVWMFTLFEEMVRRSPGRREMEEIIRSYILFEIEGWKAVMKI